MAANEQKDKDTWNVVYQHLVTKVENEVSCLERLWKVYERLFKSLLNTMVAVPKEELVTAIVSKRGGSGDSIRTTGFYSLSSGSRNDPGQPTSVLLLHKASKITLQSPPGTRKDWNAEDSAQVWCEVTDPAGEEATWVATWASCAFGTHCLPHAPVQPPHVPSQLAAVLFTGIRSLCRGRDGEKRLQTFKIIKALYICSHETFSYVK